MNNPDHDKIVITTLNQSSVYSCLDIMYCSAEGAYSCIYLKNGAKQLVSKNLISMSQQLNYFYFIRISRFLLLNVFYIAHINHKERKISLINGTCLSYTIKTKVLLRCLNIALEKREVL